MIDRYHLRYFLAVIDHGNFSKAAAACNVAQPTLSVGITKMERAIGKPLFLRSNKRVELTEAGARLVVRARLIEMEFTLAEREAEESAARVRLRLGFLETLPLRWIETFLLRQRLNPVAERIELVEGRETDLLKRLTRGRIDVALTIIPTSARRFLSEPLFAEDYVLAAAISHPLASARQVTAEQLIKDTMIVRRHCELLPETSRFFTARGVRPFFSARTFNEERALAYVRAGLGITIVPDCYTGGDVARIRLVDFNFMRTIGLVYARQAEEIRDSSALRILRETIRDVRLASA